MNPSINTLIDSINKIVEHFDNDAEFNFKVDYDDVTYEEFNFVFNFKQKEFEIMHEYNYYDTNYTTSEKKFDNISDSAKEEIDEFCSANKMFKVSFQGSGDSGYIDSAGVLGKNPCTLFARIGRRSKYARGIVQPSTRASAFSLM